MSWKTKLAKLEKVAAEIMARRPADPRQTTRAIVEFLKSIGLDPKLIGLDENGGEIPGFADPEDPPSFIPLNLPVLRFLHLIQQVDDSLALLDDPARMSAMDEDMRVAAAQSAAAVSAEDRRAWRELFMPFLAAPNAPMPPELI